MKKIVRIAGIVLLAAVVVFLVAVKLHFRKGRIAATAMGTEALQAAETGLRERWTALERDFPDWEKRDPASDGQFQVSLEVMELDVKLYHELLDTYNSLLDMKHVPPPDVQALIERVEARRR
jgi:hypothetical protein